MKGLMDMKWTEAQHCNISSNTPRELQEELLDLAWIIATLVDFHALTRDYLITAQRYDIFTRRWS